jgi:hypothetical protein
VFRSVLVHVDLSGAVSVVSAVLVQVDLACAGAARAPVAMVTAMAMSALVLFMVLLSARAPVGCRSLR